jgi:hypothetical protein
VRPNISICLPGFSAMDYRVHHAAKLVPADSDAVVQIHYTPKGQESSASAATQGTKPRRQKLAGAESRKCRWGIDPRARKAKAIDWTDGRNKTGTGHRGSSWFWRFRELLIAKRWRASPRNCTSPLGAAVDHGRNPGSKDANGRRSDFYGDLWASRPLRQRRNRVAVTV